MISDSFSKTVQTFGADPMRWETDRKDALNIWATTEGATVLQTEKALDDLLNTVQPPPCSGLAERIYAIASNDALRGQLLIFLRFVPWVSVACAVFGFCLGWSQNHADAANTQSYFETMFDTFYEQY